MKLFVVTYLTIVQDAQDIQANTIYICDEETTLNLHRFSKSPLPINSYNPNIDKLFSSFVPLCSSKKLLCILLTGIGSDGVDASVELSKNGARVITQTKESAIVDGMTSRARELVPDVEIYDMEHIIMEIGKFIDNA